LTCSAAASPAPATRPRVSDSYAPSGGHWIRDNADGKIITLEDGSLWQIESIDQVDTTLWLPITDIVVLRDSRASGEYKYLLLDKDDGEKAHAKYLGRE
jgi:phage terminase large subunit-like protein